ncbi:MAG TPA: ABC transporter ATP-binding protein [Acidimicrobiia bacterium]|nr:ABC transporter ATP-binding protein [Acidimicrobiia bacterium]
MTVTFGGLTALESVSLSLASGEVVGVIGPNGAGKTTLFNVICGFVDPRSGHIALDGRRIRRMRPHRLAKLGIARTVQGVRLWPGMTVLENVMAGGQFRERSTLASALGGVPPSSSDEDKLAAHAMSVLEELDVGDVAGRLPSTLPYAIQKRVAFARALVADPRFLLLDEPASGLSEGDMESLGQLLTRLKERMGILLVEHHMDLVMSVCDRIVVLDFGEVIATGTPDEVKDDPAVTAAYLGEEVQPHDAGPAEGRAGAQR